MLKDADFSHVEVLREVKEEALAADLKRLRQEVGPERREDFLTGSSDFEVLW